MPTAFAKQLPESHYGQLVKLGSGEVGGKARGLGFLSAQLELYNIAHEFAPHRIVVPETTVLATDEFDRYLEDNALREIAGQPDEAIYQAVLDRPLQPCVETTLKRFVLQHRGPIAVRSSSLSEDGEEHPFAGIFLTYMLPNNAQSIDHRVHQLSQAVRLVWSSLLCREPMSYMQTQGIDPDREKMAVILQEVVGSPRSSVFYPLCSGVAQSYNYFPVGSQRAEDGFASIVLGLGKRAVEHDDALCFSPTRPTVRPESHRMGELIRASQREFYAVDLRSGERPLTGYDRDTLDLLLINAAEPHGTLDDLASTWVLEDQTLYEGTLRDGKRVLTFHRLLRGELFPLPALISRILSIMSDGFGCAVELEFALTLDEVDGERRGTFHLLQARPMGFNSKKSDEPLVQVPESQVLLRSTRAMGHCHIRDIRHVLYLDPSSFDAGVAHEAAAEIAKVNDALSAAEEPYLLVVPGRLGTRNSSLGVPVTFPQVSGAAALVELSTEEMNAEPSQGTHFFHNMVSQGMPLLAVETRSGDIFNEAWFRSQDCERHGPLLHIRPDPAVVVHVVGPRQEGVVYQGG